MPQCMYVVRSFIYPKPDPVISSLDPPTQGTGVVHEQRDIGFFLSIENAILEFLSQHQIAYSRNKPEIVPFLSSCAPGGPGRWTGSWQRRTPTQTRRQRRSWPRDKCPPPWCRTLGAWTHSLQWWWWTWSALWWCLDTIERPHSNSTANCRLKMCLNPSLSIFTFTE